MRHEGVAHISALGKSRAEAEGEAQWGVPDYAPAVACTHMNCAARSHERPRSRYPAIRHPEGPRQPEHRTEFPAVPLSWSPWLVRPVTLRRHLSVVLPLS